MGSHGTFGKPPVRLNHHPGEEHHRTPPRQDGDAVVAGEADRIGIDAALSERAVQPNSMDSESDTLSHDADRGPGMGGDDHGVHTFRYRAQIGGASIAL